MQIICLAAHNFLSSKNSGKEPPQDKGRTQGRQRRDSLGADAGRPRQVLRQVRTSARWVLLVRAASRVYGLVLRQVGDGVGGPSAGERRGSGVLLRNQARGMLLGSREGGRLTALEVNTFPSRCAVRRRPRERWREIGRAHV